MAYHRFRFVIGLAWFCLVLFWCALPVTLAAKQAQGRMAISQLFAPGMIRSSRMVLISLALLGRTCSVRNWFNFCHFQKEKLASGFRLDGIILSGLYTFRSNQLFLVLCPFGSGLGGCCRIGIHLLGLATPPKPVAYIPFME